MAEHVERVLGRSLPPPYQSLTNRMCDALLWGAMHVEGECEIYVQRATEMLEPCVLLPGINQDCDLGLINL